MVPIQDFNLNIPVSMVGKWKMKVLATSGKHTTCFENDFELVETNAK